MRTWLRLLLVLVAAVLAQGCRGPAVAPEMARALEEGRLFGQSLVTRSRQEPRTAADTAALVALGYLERARVGLGSPFRLVDFALNDPRLGDGLRASTAWALLAMVHDGETHQVEPAALDSLFQHPMANRAEVAGELVALIDRTVRAEEDPRAGELAVRLAFSLGSTERLLRSTAPILGARAAALARDRAVARADLLALLREAQETRADPVRLVPTWRLARRFAVEKPVLDQPTPAQEIAAVRRATGLLAAMRRMVERSLATTADSADAPAPGHEYASLLTEPAARRLASLPQVRQMPPQSPVVVALTASRDRILAEDGVAGPLRTARERFVEDATNEERLVARRAMLGRAGGRRVAGATLWAASAMRSYSQETAWFPNTGGPTVTDLKARFGIASVSFDRDVPVEWRPYFRRLLQSSLADLERVLPALEFRGIGIHFGEQPLESALAVHDPRTRTVFVPLGTGPGTLAHELAHDLDWQVAARHFGKRGEYSTDQAVREHRGTLATSLRGLTSAALVPPGPENQFRPPHTQRPTEVFATSVDWYVAATLSREGRMNGYLTAVQDETLTGFAAVRPPDVHGAAGDATVAVLGEMTALPVASRGWFLERFGQPRELTAMDRVRRVLELTSAAGSARALLPTGPSGDSPLLPTPTACVARERTGDALAAARRQASELAARSVARRLLAQRGLRTATGHSVRLGPMLAAPTPVDPQLVTEELDRLTREVLDRVHRLESERSWLPTTVTFWGAC